MKIVFLCYWGFDDGLTQSTVIPHLKILASMPAISEVYFYTIERNGPWKQSQLPDNVIHFPLVSGKAYLHKIWDFLSIPAVISRKVAKLKIDFMICRGTPAGAIGYLVHKRTGIHYAVESFEPHANYMAESNVWRTWGLRYLFQRFWESRQISTAEHLMPVAEPMKEYLSLRAVAESRIHIMPCAVNTESFVFDERERRRLRHDMQVTEDCVLGMYVGKFGGLYYDEEAFLIFQKASEHFKSFKLVILTPDAQDQIAENLLRSGFRKDQFYVGNVPHMDVPAFLSAADFAFALYRPSPSKKFLSPVKVGEYWSIGLPVLITHGIGDASSLIEENDAGAVMDLASIETSLRRISSLLDGNRIALRKRIRDLAIRTRSYQVPERIYSHIINQVAIRVKRKSVTRDPQRS